MQIYVVPSSKKKRNPIKTKLKEEKTSMIQETNTSRFKGVETKTSFPINKTNSKYECFDEREIRHRCCEGSKE